MSTQLILHIISLISISINLGVRIRDKDIDSCLGWAIALIWCVISAIQYI